MPEYLVPGVNIEEIPTGPKPIEGLSTSTTGFVGPCRYGQVIGPAALVTSLVEFERVFAGGAPLAFAKSASAAATPPTEHYLWHAARAFFAEGGERLYISRVFHPLAGEYPPMSAAADLGDAGAPKWSDGHGRFSRGTLSVRARFPGAAGNLIVRLTLQPPAPGVSPQDATLAIDVASAVGTDVMVHWNSLSLESSRTDSVFGRFAADPPVGDPARETPVIFDTPDSPLSVTELIADWFSLGPTASLPSANATREIQLAGGNDGMFPRSVEYTGAASSIADSDTGLTTFEDIHDISIVAAPGAAARYVDDPVDVDAINGALIAHAERMRYRIAVLDSPPGMDTANVKQWRKPLDSSRAALYYPWITIKDPHTGRDLDLPPSGFIAGIYARTDAQRGVFKAPANEVVSLAVNFERRITDAEQGLLNPVGINSLRFFPGRGYLVWGSRTLASHSEFRYVSVRRFLLYVEQSIVRGTRWVVHEPNDESLWARVRLLVNGFLTSEWRKGAMPGSTAKEAFFVECGRGTMNQDDIDNGRLVCEIGIATVRPAEFVIVRIEQWTADHHD